jgi:Zn-dependent alcohol dehydrogenase
MRGAVCYQFGEPLVIEDLELRPPAPGAITVQVAACGVCHSDIHFIDGARGGPLPALYGHEIAGVVSGVGPGVSELLLGQRVVASLIRRCGTCPFCRRGQSFLCSGTFALDSEPHITGPHGPVMPAMNTGGFAEYVTVDQSQIVAIPSDIAFPVASLLACGVITGYGAVTKTASVTGGSSVVVIGTGGVGLNAIQGAVAVGADPLIAVDIVDDKLEVARSFGATETVNSSEGDPGAAVRDLTKGQGADYAFVTVGIGPVIAQAIDMIRPGGTVVLVGLPADGVMVPAEAANLASYAKSIVGSKMGSSTIANDIPHLIDEYRAGRLKLDELVSGEFSLDNINEAIDGARQGSALRNVIVFD